MKGHENHNIFVMFDGQVGTGMSENGIEQLVLRRSIM